MLQLPYKYRGPATSQKTRENDWNQEPNMAPATYMLLVSAFVVGLLNGTGVINVTGVIHGTGVIMMLDNPPWFLLPFQLCSTQDRLENSLSIFIFGIFNLT